MANNNENLSMLFIQAAERATFNSSKWTPQESTSLKKLWGISMPGSYENIQQCECVMVPFDGGYGKKIRVTMKNGGQLDLACSGTSLLEEGELVDPATITATRLTKLGQKDIVRFDGQAIV